MTLPAGLPADWPHRQASRVVSAAGLAWHVQVEGHGPHVMLLHGSGASAHTWADVMPLLWPRACVSAPDLPGHGFTTGAAIDSLTLTRVSAALDDLVARLGLGEPALVVGHSAGAALALRWALDRQARGVPGPRHGLVGFNPSLVAPPELYLRLMAPWINPLATSSPMAWLLSNVAPGSGMVDRLLDSTHSVLPPPQRARYRHLFARREHVQGTLGFMAAADLPALLAAGPALKTAQTFVVGSRDAWVPAAPLRQTIERAFPRARVVHWIGGHLLHEEAPGDAAELIASLLPASRSGVETGP